MSKVEHRCLRVRLKVASKWYGPDTTTVAITTKYSEREGEFVHRCIRKVRFGIDRIKMLTLKIAKKKQLDEEDALRQQQAAQNQRVKDNLTDIMRVTEEVNSEVEREFAIIH